MSNTIYAMQAVNLFCGDHDPTKSKHLTIRELKLPAFQAIYADHHAGGSRFATEIEVGIQGTGIKAGIIKVASDEGIMVENPRCFEGK